MDWPAAIPILDALRPWSGAGVALLAALGAALAGRALRRPALAGAAAGIGILAGWWATFGLLTATPRQLPERLPLLMLVLVVFAPLAGLAARRWPPAGVPLAALGALGAGWWMAGAPLVVPDLARAAPVLAGVAAGALVLLLAMRARWAAPVAAAVLLGGLAAAALPGPQAVLGAALLAAAAAASAMPPGRGGAAHPALAALPAAAAIAALGAIPLLARGAPADWAAAAAPFAALLVGAPAGFRLGGHGGAAAGAALAGSGAAAVAFLLR
jgi:hypothetical protein